MSSLLNGYRLTQMVYVAARLGIADHLIKGPRTVEELAAASGAHAESLQRLLRALAGGGVRRRRREAIPCDAGVGITP
jgi:hypothetical protein